MGGLNGLGSLFGGEGSRFGDSLKESGLGLRLSMEGEGERLTGDALLQTSKNDFVRVMMSVRGEGERRRGGGLGLLRSRNIANEKETSVFKDDQKQ